MLNLVHVSLRLSISSKHLDNPKTKSLSNKTNNIFRELDREILLSLSATISHTHQQKLFNMAITSSRIFTLDCKTDGL